MRGSSEQWFCAAGIRGPDADGFGKGGGDSVGSDSRFYAFCLKAIAIEDDREEECRRL